MSFEYNGKKTESDNLASIQEENEDRVLIDFSVENFRSFGAEQTLNMIASSKFQEHQDHCIPIGETGKSFLRTGVIYGANAAGKSNLIRAVLFAQNLIEGNVSLKKLAFITLA